MSEPKPASVSGRSNLTTVLSVLAPAVLAVMALVFYATEILLLTFYPVPAANRDVVAGAVGFIGGSLVGCSFGFYFGASLHAKPPAADKPAAPVYGA